MAAAADRLGWDGHTTDWRELVARDDIDVVDICTPGDSHAEIAIAALAAGKHVLCEKPLANTVAEARAMVAAAADGAGRRGAVDVRVQLPPGARGRADAPAGRRPGGSASIRHVRAVVPAGLDRRPAVPAGVAAAEGQGRLRRARRHRRAHHRPDPVRHRPADHRGQRADRDVRQGAAAAGRVQRPGRRRRQRRDGRATGPVTVDDAALFLARLDGGAVATYEASRFATGRKNGLRVEINGSLGSLVFDLERLNELEFYDADAPAAEQGFTRILVTEGDHPYMSAWWPPGHIIGYEHSFTHQMRDFIEAVATGADPTPSFADALQVQLVLDAVTRSAELGSSWTEVEPALAALAA